MSEHARDPKILYVGSYGRSGSTLLGRMLAEAPGAICVGETRYLWSRGLVDDAECGCGVPFGECAFWSAVAREAYGGWGGIDAERMADLDRMLNRLRTLPAHVLARRAPRVRRAVEEYAVQLAALYRAIASVGAAHTVIEISKDPTFACVLARTAGSQVSVVHLTRDPRAVAYSWTRLRREPSPIAGREFMPRFRPAGTAIKWVAFDTGLRALPLAGLRRMTLTYERLIADPKNALERIGRFAGLAGAGDATTSSGEVHLGAHHMFSANPMRTRTGAIALRVDDEWRTRMSDGAFLAVTTLTSPLLRVYGYPLARRRPSSLAERGSHDELVRA